jgi:predicted nucleotidyltransferase component of viral defense system
VSKQIKNLSASIRARLKNRARDLSLPFNQLLQRYAIERFLYRLSQSEYSEKFILKGGQMLLVWNSEQLRPTRDIDFLGVTENSLDNLKSIMCDLCKRNIQEADGIYFDPDTVDSERIIDESEYKGVRVTFNGLLDTAVINIQIDIGFDDAVTPAPDIVNYPSIFGTEEPKLRGYNRETLIAEKFEIMVKRGELNSRIKDFYDIWMLCSNFNFDRRKIGEALIATFEQRGTALDEMPAVLQPGFDQYDTKQTQWSAFLRKSGIKYAPKQFSEITAQIFMFIDPILNSINQDATTTATWNAPGPWSEKS